ncbi:MAG TPA: tetratricopeptide repeat protein [Kofleriaceae bacterium]|nr:tetratricopeptide repeat protein [Kofleriaceae bacterium]
MRASSATLGLVLVLLAGAAGAEPDREERARAHFEAGRVQYNLGDYTGAVREFAEGYRLVPRPQFLVNLGQAYRRLGQLERAREMYDRYLADAPPGDKARAQVRVLIEEIERELTPATTAPEPAAQPEEGTATPAPRVVAAAPPARRAPFWRRHWWIFPVVGVAAIGLGLGIGLGVRAQGADDCGSSFGCLDLRR